MRVLSDQKIVGVDTHIESIQYNMSRSILREEIPWFYFFRSRAGICFPRRKLTLPEKKTGLISIFAEKMWSL